MSTIKEISNKMTNMQTKKIILYKFDKYLPNLTKVLQFHKSTILHKA